MIGWQIDNEMNCEDRCLLLRGRPRRVPRLAPAKVRHAGRAERAPGARCSGTRPTRDWAQVAADRPDPQRLAQPAPGARREAVLLRQRDRLRQLQSDDPARAGARPVGHHQRPVRPPRQPRADRPALDFSRYDSYPELQHDLPGRAGPDRAARPASGAGTCQRARSSRPTSASWSSSPARAAGPTAWPSRRPSPARCGCGPTSPSRTARTWY